MTASKRPSAADVAKFSQLDYEGFRKLATEPGLSAHERIGFPDAYRAGKEQSIWSDIETKLPHLSKKRNQRVLDVGPGCAGLPHMLIDRCREQEHELTLIDSAEMLAQLPDGPHIEKIEGFFPRECKQWIDQHRGKIDVLLCYSVAHYLFVESSLFGFLDSCMQLLAPDGLLLVGDIPNVSKRKRFFSSETGVAFHRAFMQTAEAPLVEHLRIETGNVDDAVLVGLMQRARAAGFDAWILPQADDLPMANRREDLLVRRP